MDNITNRFENKKQSPIQEEISAKPLAEKIQKVKAQIPLPQAAPEELLVEKTLANWTELNLNRSKATPQRKAEKIDSIHNLIAFLAEQEGIPPEEIEEVRAFNEKYSEPPLLLESYLRQFPEFQEILMALRTSEQIDSRLRITLSS